MVSTDRWRRRSRCSARVAHGWRRNSRKGSRRNIQAHYDLGNDLFRLFLDQRMMYSAAVFDTGEETLEQASEAKLSRLCRKLDLHPSDHLLEIGTGWGGFCGVRGATIRLPGHHHDDLECPVRTRPGP